MTRKPPTPAAAALDWIRRALIDELPGDELATVPERAEALQAICTHYGMPVEYLITWIHENEPWELDALAWKRWCQEWHEAQLAGERVQITPEHWPE